jgi:hypothetical protein
MKISEIAQAKKKKKKNLAGGDRLRKGVAANTYQSDVGLVRLLLVVHCLAVIIGQRVRPGNRLESVFTTKEKKKKWNKKKEFRAAYHPRRDVLERLRFGPYPCATVG